MPDSNVSGRERWARRSDKPMRTAEKLGEVEWLLSLGEHPTHVAAQLGTNVAALEKLARCNGRPDLSALLRSATRRADVLWGNQHESFESAA